MCRETCLHRGSTASNCKTRRGELIRCGQALSSEHGQDRQSLDHRHRLGGVVPLFCRGAAIGHAGLAGAQCRRRRRTNRTSGVAAGARALLPKSARGRGQKSLLLCHGRHASPRFGRWQIGAAVLRYLRIRPVVSCNFGGSRRRPRFERHRGFRQRKAVREELWQCAGLCLTAGGAYVTAETKTSFKGYYRASAKQDAVLIRSFVQFDGEGESRKRQTARDRRTSGRIVAERLSSKRSAQLLRGPRRLRSVRAAGGVCRGPQRRLHQLVAVGRRANRRHGEGQSDDAVHLP